MNGWKYYNHSVLPDLPPNAEPEVSKEIFRKLFREHKKALLIRYITDFDSKTETNFWYVIKDTPFDPEALKAKRRYEITKGSRNFEVRRICPSELTDALYEITQKALATWPEKYRPTVVKSEFSEEMKRWDEHLTYGAFSRESGALCAYAYLEETEAHFEFRIMRVDPTCERDGINAALVAGILADNREALEKGKFVNDGSRSVQHETAFQDYLEKYFAFRKAYCRLHIVYRPGIAFLVRLLYPFRAFFAKFDSVSPIHKINGILKMETLCREEKR